MRPTYELRDLIVLAFQNIEECSWEAEDTGLIFLHFCLVNIPPGIHNDLVLDGMYATLIVSEVDLSVEYWDEVRGCEDEVHSVPDGLCLLYTSPSPRDRTRSRMPSSA